MAFWQFLKSRFCKILSSTRAEYRTDKTDDNEYVINGVRYVVTSFFSKTENKTVKEKISAFIGSDFAHLTTDNDINTINTECV